MADKPFRAIDLRLFVYWRNELPVDIIKTIGELAEAVKYLAALIAVVVFLVFFALSPLHALLLCGLLMVLAAFATKADPTIQKLALCLGFGIMAVGTVGIFVPTFTRTLLSLAEGLKQLLLLEV